MRTLFFGPRTPSGPIRLPLPDMVTILLGAYFRPKGALPTEADLKRITGEGRDRHVEEPLRQILAGLADGPVLELQVGGRDSRPQPPADLISTTSSGELEERRFADATQPSPSSRTASCSRRDPASGPCCPLRAPSRRRWREWCSSQKCPASPISSYEEHLPADGAIAVAHHIFLLAFTGSRGLLRMTSNGMRKVGLPELELADAPPDLSDELLPVRNGTAQHLMSAVQRLASIRSVSRHASRSVSSLLMGVKMKRWKKRISHTLSCGSTMMLAPFRSPWT